MAAFHLLGACRSRAPPGAGCSARAGSSPAPAWPLPRCRSADRAGGRHLRCSAGSSAAGSAAAAGSAGSAGPRGTASSALRPAKSATAGG
ncbi:hypothetical protein G6F64_014874 [Rhizopus arrhizus]|uniref:Uncharacterized protein n=1 Tax=Rhizopus oryzae TaxID=64495 RepID=A0A9P6WSM7_RHIOR|nr:hypothetical protein G6F64_014874 [Rhizopus arrhizus]